jgi:hypothetical protein
MKKSAKLALYGVLALTMAFTSCNKEEFEEPAYIAQEPPLPKIPVNEESYNFYIEDKFPTMQLRLKYPPELKDHLETKVLQVYLISTINGVEHQYLVPGIGARSDHHIYKRDEGTEIVIEFSDLDRYPYRVPFGYYQKAKIRVHDNPI